MLGRAVKFYYALLLGILVLAASNVGATQYIAHAYSYHPNLGRPDLALFGVPLYMPLMWLVWMFKYHSHHPEIFNAAYLVFAGTFFVGLFLVIAVMRIGPAKASKKFGSARWATKKELAPLVSTSGVILGAPTDENLHKDGLPRLLAHNGPEHTILVAPAGRTSATVIPTLFRFLAAFCFRR